ncbi:MAG: ABC transporter permease [Elusimicrobia bacterium]|nr:ABC transporter permease [Elusimicrobiota bacterium]
MEQIEAAAHGIGGAVYMVKTVLGLLFDKPDDTRNIFKQMVRVGVDSMPIVLLSSLFTGMVLALQSGVASIKVFDEAIFIGTLVSFSMVLELGPVLTAMVLAGRVGASITAEIGTMKVTEQIDALYTLGTTPEKYLAVPLFIATIIMLPVVTLIADVTGIAGGYVVAIKAFDIPGSVYRNDILTHLQIVHFVHGLVKSVFFAFIIVTVSCYKGFTTAGGAEGVGRSTTRAVVISMILILTLDYFLSTLLNVLGII